MTRTERNASIRVALREQARWMGNPRERAAHVGHHAILRDAKRWHEMSRGRMATALDPIECAAWALLYRGAFYGHVRG